MIYLICRLALGTRTHARLKIKHCEGSEGSLCGVYPSARKSWVETPEATVDCPKCKSRMKTFNGNKH
jgi:hypothetical protein